MTEKIDDREIAYQEYSDAHKDIYGIRPTWMAKVFREGTKEEYENELKKIWEEYRKDQK
jgi:flagellum-specific peptidoglycan hydrolase FlgJ